MHCFPMTAAGRLACTAGLLLSLSGAARAQVGFTLNATYPTGTKPVALVAGDFNADGRIDLAAANETSQNVTVLRFNVSGPPTSGLVSVSPNTPTNLAVFDITCASGSDLLVSTSNSTIKFLSNSGVGVFTLLSDGNSIAQGSPAVVAADFNGDGKPSVAGTESDGAPSPTYSLASRSGQGTGDGCGGYGGADTLQTVGNTPKGMALGSFNTINGGIRPADTRPDILVANSAAGTVSCMLYDGEAPGGGPPGGILTVTSSTTATGPNPIALVTGSFNPGVDAFTDFAVICAGDRTLRIYLGDGKGTFAAGNIYKLPPGPAAIAVGDINGDSIPDLAVVSSGALPAGVNPSFTGIGVLPGGATFISNGFGLSSDGSTVVGYSQSTSGDQAIRWTSAGGISGLGDLAGGSFYSLAFGASANGSVIAGTGWSTASGGNLEGFRWTQATGPVGIGDLAPASIFASYGSAVSDDGTAIAGSSFGNLGGWEAARWTQATGLVGLGDLPGGRVEAYGTDISYDGSVIVGDAASASVVQPDAFEAFRWTQATGMVGLGDLPGASYNSRGIGVSGDGTTVVGYSGTDTAPLGGRNDPYYWTQSTGMVSLGIIPGGSVGGTAWDANDNGTVIVGQGNIATGGDAFRWTKAEGLKMVRDLLTAAGVNPGTWAIRETVGVSADGTALCGTGINPAGRQEGWYARLPLPPTCQVYTGSATGAFTLRSSFTVGRSPTSVVIAQLAGGPRPDIAVTNGQDNNVTVYENTSCPADYDGNGQITPADVSAFVNVWFNSVQNATLAGDFDGSGAVNPADVSAFVNAWFNALTGGC